MGKNILFCADGTWNGPGQEGCSPQDDPASNVLRTFLLLQGEDLIDEATYRAADEQERCLSGPDGRVAQVAKYLHGVGDSTNFLVKALGGALGAGLITRIVRGFTYLSRQYQPGDRLFIVGFSRGAYTARSLAGLICARGLLDPQQHDLSDKEQAYRLGCSVWADYRSTICHEAGADWEERMEALLDDLPRFFGSPVHLVADVSVEAVAVWDTVGALGIPQYQADHARLDVFRFCDDKLHPKVARGLHAIAIDEQRADFTPTLWDRDPARITQVLFPGAHGDVGGGYPRTRGESGLSDGALQWMVAQLQALGVAFREQAPFPIQPDPLGVAHQPWTRAPWNLQPPRARTGLQGLPCDASYDRRLGQRVLADPALCERTVYRPDNLA